MDAWLMMIATAVVGVVIGKLLYEVNPSVWKSAAARVEEDTPPDGAILDYFEWVKAEISYHQSPVAGAKAIYAAAVSWRKVHG